MYWPFSFIITQYVCVCRQSVTIGSREQEYPTQQSVG
ncbi:MAG: hypothetical protein BWY58_00636 [Chloroflexi bacterium ADurb.Bin344]|nr:MAG: hypothetical protein BWY58_00636 [Chloroflexi bacterium ADurb.Bin344]